LIDKDLDERKGPRRHDWGRGKVKGARRTHKNKEEGKKEERKKDNNSGGQMVREFQCGAKRAKEHRKKEREKGQPGKDLGKVPKSGENSGQYCRKHDLRGGRKRGSPY